MQTEELLVPERAEVDMYCDACLKEITEGEDFFYDHTSEENYCEKCASQKDNYLNQSIF